MTSEQPDTYSIKETCAKLDRTRYTVWRLIKAGTLSARKVGPARNAEVLVDARSVDTYLDGRPVDADNTQANA